MKELKVGIVGVGWVAGAHIETFKSVKGSAGVTAVCSRRTLDPAALEKQYGVPLKAYTNYEQMLADKDIDIISICTPHPLHREQAVAAARAGKHVLLEKPIAISWEDCKAIRDAVKKAGVRCCVCFEVRFSDQFTLTQSIIQQGLVGQIHYAEVDYYHGVGPWYAQFEWNIKKEFGGSALITAGCHSLDILLMLMDEPVEEVMSYATRSQSKFFAPYEYPTTSTTLLKFASGRLGKCAASIDCLQPYYFHTHLVGSEGSVLDNQIYSHKLKGLSKAKWTTLETKVVNSGAVNDHPYLPQFQAFVDGIHSGQDMPLTNLDIALETHRVAFASDKSVAEGRPVKLAELT